MPGITPRSRQGRLIRHRMPSLWWRGGVIYEVYPRSWRDSDGDGVGDLRGIISGLDYLKWLGVDGLWLNPITPSPDYDCGYDVSDYLDIHPVLGTLDIFDEFVAKAASRSISVILDLVPSHTSDQHPWFVDARKSKRSRYRDFYVWRRPRPDGSPPNNWIGYFGHEAWTFDEATDEYYMHNFSSHQPQLNWWNPEVRTQFKRILEFWFKRGIGGMRIDAVQALLYDTRFRDNPPATKKDSAKERQIGQKLKYNANQPGVHDVIKSWRTIANRFDPPRLLFGETWVPSIEEMVKYYGNGANEFDLAWNLPFMQSRFAGRPLRQVIERTLTSLPDEAWPVWAMSTHDSEGRAARRWARGSPAASRCALMILLTLRGTPILYYGDEIGMTGPPRRAMQLVTRDQAQANISRDASRTPMQWSTAPGAGFTTSSRPWLPISDATKANVEAQKADPQSILSLTRDLLVLRRTVPDLATGAMVVRDSPAGVLAWQRGKDMLVAVNLSANMCHVKTQGSIVICTNRARDGERVGASLKLRPYEGAIVKR
jgi:alpha-glucosidase